MCVNGNSTVSEEYLTIEEVASRLKLKPKTIKNKMAAGIFKKGRHYFSPRGLRPRFKWSAVQAWLEGEDDESAPQKLEIPMARGYLLGASSVKGKKSGLLDR